MLSDLSRPGVKELEAYQPGKPIEEVQEEYGLTEVVKLASNENPWGASPHAVKAVKEALAKLAVYPDGQCTRLRRRIAETLDLRPEHVTVSNGASNILVMIAEAFLDRGDEAVMALPTFPVYRKSAHMVGAKAVQVPLKKHTHDLEAMREAVTGRTRLVYICNPNNPTGTIVERERTAAFLESLPPTVVVVMDEVYTDFSPSDDLPDTLGFIRTERPVISVRSFSKLYGLAALRVGYALAAPALIELLNKVREAFPVNSLAQAAATAAIDDTGFRDRVIRSTREGIAFLSDAFERMGLSHIPSHGNFVFVDVGRDNQTVFKAMLERGVIVRPLPLKDYRQWCRISVGTPDQNRRLIETLEAVLGRRS